MDYFNNQSSQKKAIIQKCLLFGSENADNRLLHDKAVDKIQLHGFNNYILHLNALWLYARKISAPKQTDAKCRTQIINELPIRNTQERNDIDTLLNTIPEIYKLYSQKEHQPNKFEKQYLVLGLALHLIGDIYAHRTVITPQMARRMFEDQTLDEKEFTKCKKYPEFLEKLKKGKIHCSNLDKFMVHSGNNMLYEDNTAFLPNRYKYSRASAKKFISNYVRSGSVFQSSYLKQNPADEITLDEFDNFK